MWNRRQTRHIAIVVIPLGLLVMGGFSVFGISNTMLSNLALGVVWFATLTAAIQVVITHIALRADNARLSEASQSLLLGLAIGAAVVSYIHVAEDIFLG